MSEQPQGEWDKMSKQQRDQYRASFRLVAAMADVERGNLRARLARASKPSARISGLHLTGI